MKKKPYTTAEAHAITNALCKKAQKELSKPAKQKEIIKEFMMKIYYQNNCITAVTINNYQKLTLTELIEIKYRIDYLYNDRKDEKAKK
jgi:hypothetical protein